MTLVLASVRRDAAMRVERLACDFVLNGRAAGRYGGRRYRYYISQVSRSTIGS